jgi:hypothetical protein
MGKTLSDMGPDADVILILQKPNVPLAGWDKMQYSILASKYTYGRSMTLLKGLAAWNSQDYLPFPWCYTIQASRYAGNTAE